MGTFRGICTFFWKNGWILSNFPFVSRLVGSSLSSPAAVPYLEIIRTATKKAGGTVVNKSDSAGRRLGVKKYGEEQVKVGNIIIRQRGFKFHPGMNVIAGKDHTLHAYTEGYVKFTHMVIPGKSRNKMRTYVNVVPTLSPKQSELVEFMAQIKKKYYDTLEYKKARVHEFKAIRKVIGAGRL